MYHGLDPADSLDIYSVTFYIDLPSLRYPEVLLRVVLGLVLRVRSILPEECFECCGEVGGNTLQGLGRCIGKSWVCFLEGVAYEVVQIERCMAFSSSLIRL